MLTSSPPGPVLAWSVFVKFVFAASGLETVAPTSLSARSVPPASGLGELVSPPESAVCSLSSAIRRDRLDLYQFQISNVKRRFTKVLMAPWTMSSCHRSSSNDVTRALPSIGRRPRDVMISTVRLRLWQRRPYLAPLEALPGCLFSASICPQGLGQIACAPVSIQSRFRRSSVRRANLAEKIGVAFDSDKLPQNSRHLRWPHDVITRKQETRARNQSIAFCRGKLFRDKCAA